MAPFLNEILECITPPRSTSHAPFGPMPRLEPVAKKIDPNILRIRRQGMHVDRTSSMLPPLDRAIAESAPSTSETTVARTEPLDTDHPAESSKSSSSSSSSLNRAANSLEHRSQALQGSPTPAVETAIPTSSAPTDPSPVHNLYAKLDTLAENFPPSLVPSSPQPSLDEATFPLLPPQLPSLSAQISRLTAQGGVFDLRYLLPTETLEVIRLSHDLLQASREGTLLPIDLFLGLASIRVRCPYVHPYPLAGERKLVCTRTFPSFRECYRHVQKVHAFQDRLLRTTLRRLETGRRFVLDEALEVVQCPDCGRLFGGDEIGQALAQELEHTCAIIARTMSPRDGEGWEEVDGMQATRRFARQGEEGEGHPLSPILELECWTEQHWLPHVTRLTQGMAMLGCDGC